MALVLLGLTVFGAHELHERRKAKKASKANQQAPKDLNAFYSNGANPALSRPPPPYETQPPQYTPQYAATASPRPAHPESSNYDFETRSLTPAPLNVANRHSSASSDDSSSIYGASDDGNANENLHDETQAPHIPPKSSARGLAMTHV